jgi:hypothetical protein
MGDTEDETARRTRPLIHRAGHHLLGSLFCANVAIEESQAAGAPAGGQHLENHRNLLESAKFEPLYSYSAGAGARYEIRDQAARIRRGGGKTVSEWSPLGGDVLLKGLLTVVIRRRDGRPASNQAKNKKIRDNIGLKDGLPVPKIGR